MTGMNSRLLRSAVVAVAWPGFSLAQSVVSTLLGAAPNGIAALSATLNTPSAVVGDSSGNVYAALKGTHQVVMIDPGGSVWLVAGNGASGSAGDGGPAKTAMLVAPVSLALDWAGNLYIADSSANRIRRVGTDGAISTFAGNGKAGNTGDGGPAIAASLYSPSAIAFDGSGDLLIADTSNHEIRMVTPDGTVSRIAGIGKLGTGGNGGPALSALLDAPSGIAVDSAHNIYVADTGNLWVRVITPDGNISLFAGKDTSQGNPFGGGNPNIATNATLSNPTSVAVDQAGNVYILQTGAGNIRVSRVTTDGMIANYAGTGTAGPEGDGGLAKSANINALGIATDRHNNLLIADGASNRVRIVTAADGVINTLAGNGLPAYNPRGLASNGNVLYFTDGNWVRSFDLSTRALGLVAGTGQATFFGDGAAANLAAVSSPRGLFLDSSGRLYIADSGNNRVRRIATDGTISTVAGNGMATSAGDQGPATAASLYEPDSVVADSSGNFYIAERLGHRVRMVDTNQTINTVAGTGAGGAPDAETGIAVNQKLNGPQGLAIGPAGTLLIADTGNNRIRRLYPDGTISTVAGSASGGFGGDGGPATSAMLRNPDGIGLDAAGNLLIPDTSNNAVRRVGTDGIITTIAGLLNTSGSPTAGYNGDGSPATAYSLYGPTMVAAASGCSVLISDTTNQRIRQLWPAVDYTITTNPAGLQVTVDGQPAATPVTVGLLPGTTHLIDAASPQNGPSGTRYLKTSSAQSVSVSCGPVRAAVSVSFQTQYSLTITSSDGGSVSPAAAWQNAGATVTLTGTPAAGFVFAGWEGACSGLNSCQLTMNGPASVKADFAPAQTLQAAINSGGVVGAGLSVPAVKALSSNGIASVFGSNFAVSGTARTVGAADLFNGQLPTKLAGACVLVGGTPAPIFYVQPNQINFQAPQLPASGTVQVQVATACGAAAELRSNAVTVSVQPATPEFFYFVQTASGNNPIAAQDALSGANIGLPGLLPGATFTPAKPNEILTLYATGLGATNPSFAAGQLPTQAAQVTGAVQVTLGSAVLPSANVQYVGVTPGDAGLYQINILIPAATPDGDLPVVISVGGVSSPSGGYISVRH